MSLTHVREVAAVGTFARGAHRHTYATFHIGATPVVIAACGRAHPADRPVPAGEELVSCNFCTTLATSANVWSITGNEPEGERS